MDVCCELSSFIDVQCQVSRADAQDQTGLPKACRGWAALSDRAVSTWRRELGAVRRRQLEGLLEARNCGRLRCGQQRREHKHVWSCEAERVV